uniref:Uncharacterized protein n=1 Tax=Avena sativa TaxID=4498 RepID=A0ACD6ACT2_AVESA
MARPITTTSETTIHRSQLIRTKHNNQQHSHRSSINPAMASHQQSSQSQTQQSVGFEDYLPVMAERLGEEGLMQELASGFRLLMDPSSGLITFESLRRNAPLLGLGGMSDADLRGMLAEGDFDGDGALSEMEFCVLMVRLSPDLMDEPRRWLDDAVAQASQFLFTS